MPSPTVDERIAALRPGIDYRYGTRRPYRACPPDFMETYLALGCEKAINEHYHCNWATLRRWIDESGGESLRMARAALTGMPLRPYRRSRLPTYAEAVAAIVAIRSEGTHGGGAAPYRDAFHSMSRNVT